MRFVFVVGNSRSGTTMMGRILNNHSRIYTFPELHFFEQLWSSRDQNKKIDGTTAQALAARLINIAREGYFARLHIDDYLNEAETCLGSVPTEGLYPHEVLARVVRAEVVRHQKDIACDQTPQNVFYIKEILQLFPDALFINMVRDPRDVLLSQKRKWRRRFLGGTHANWYETIRAWVNYHPITISRLWVAAVRAGAQGDLQKVHTVYFEQLLQHPDDVIEGICQFLNISYSAHLKEVPQVGSSSGMDQAESKGINKARLQSWRSGGLSKAELWLCQKICKDTMCTHGYEPIPVAWTPWVIGQVVAFPVKLAVALVMNLHRMKNIVETIRKRLH